jgi:hypothetical protein
MMSARADAVGSERITGADFLGGAKRRMLTEEHSSSSAAALTL